MTLTLYTGRQNEGKTGGLSVEAFKDWIDGRTIYTNTWLCFPHILINKDFILDIVEKGISIKNATFVLDEFWLWIDARKRDTIMSYFYLQSSKDDLNLLMSAQTERQIDIRLRENLHYWGRCKRTIVYRRKMINLPSQFLHMRTELPQIIQDVLFIEVKIYIPNDSIRRIVFDDFKLHKTKYIYAKQFYKLFNTAQKIKLKV